MGKSLKNKSLNKIKEKIELMNQYSLNNSREDNINKITKSNLISTAQRISAPFGSSSIKTTLKPTQLSNDPGPGSYGQSLNKNIFNTIFNPNKFFITGDTRFKSSDNNIPGVGEYNINIYNNKFSTPRKISSQTYKNIHSHDFILNEKLQTLPNRYPPYYLDDKEDEEMNKSGRDIKTQNNNSNNNSFNNNYNLLDFQKHNNAIDWKKVSKKNLETEGNILDSKSITNDFIMLTEFNILNNKNESSRSLKKPVNKNIKDQKQVLYKNNILGFKDSYDSSYINLTSIPFKNKKNRKEQIDPGPGAYEPYNENFKAKPMKNKYQNFGTYESRNMNPIYLNKNKFRVITSENTLNNFRLKRRIRENNNQLNKYKKLLHNLRINLIKEQAKQYKTNVENNLGPGSYSPESLFNIKKIKINKLSKTININTNKERIPSYIEMNDNPGVGEYDVIGEFKNNIENNLNLQHSLRNKEEHDKKMMLEKYKKKLKKLERKVIRLDYKDTEEYRLRKQFMNSSNIFRPPFNSAEPKFKPEKIKDETNIVLNEDIYFYPKKEINHLKIPFLSRAKRASNETINSKSMKKVGPGSYEQKSFFDWNKKSFNVQYKLK